MSRNTVERLDLLAGVSLHDELVVRGSEPHGHAIRCPLPDHDDRSASASYTPATDGSPELWYCHRCGVGGTVIDLFIHADSESTERALERTREVAERRSPPRPSPRRAASTAKATVPAGGTVPDEQTVRAWADALDTDEAHQARLTELRGWSPQVMKQLQIGVHRRLPGACTHHDPRVSIPVRGADGRLVGVVCYQPNQQRRSDTVRKTYAIGRRDLFPAPESFDAGDKWLVLCEGEPDALAGTSVGLMVVAAPGTGKWAPEWDDRFVGRRVLVIGDCDAEGRAWAARVAERLAMTASQTRVGDLAPERDDGYDLTDWTRDHAAVWGGDHAAVAASLEALAGGALRMRADAAPRDPFASLGRVRAADLRDRVSNVSWLWGQRIPLGTITALAGKQGLGKSLAAIRIAAAVTRGTLDGNLYGTPSSVVMVSYEDAFLTTVVPRLEAAGADLERVVLIDGTTLHPDRLLSLPRDNALLEREVRVENARLLVIDPLGSALDAGVDAHRDNEVRAALAPVNALAANCAAAVLLVMHRRKAYGGEAVDSVMGSTAFTAAARSVLFFSACPDDPDGHRVLAQAKSNVGRFPPSLRFGIRQAQIDGPDGPVETAELVPAGESGYQADDLALYTRARRGEPLQDACDFLSSALSAGPVAARDVTAKAAAEGISAATLRRAKSKVGVSARKKTGETDGGWIWSLPGAAAEPVLF